MSSKDVLPHAMLAAFALATMIVLYAFLTGPAAGSRSVATLLYSNDDDSPVRVYLGSPAGSDIRTLGVVDAASMRCMSLYSAPGSAESAIAVRRLADSALYWSPAFYPDAAPGWSIHVGRHPAIDMMSLQPDRQCHAKGAAL